MGGVSDKPNVKTLGELRAAGYTSRTLREELRENLLAALAAGRDPWPGMHGFDTTVIPQVERAIIAGHDIVLLGERGQGKTRLLRTLVGLLDEWSPVVAVVLGVGLAVAEQALGHLPAFQAGAGGLLVGLAASGVYDASKLAGGRPVTSPEVAPPAAPPAVPPAQDALH